MSQEKTIPCTPLDAPEGTWTLAVLPDTQGYVCDFPQVFLHQTRWIAAHKDSHRIRAVIHLGDIVESNSPAEWEIGKQAMDALTQNHVPYVLTLGNHDLDIPSRSRSTLANRYFAPSDFLGTRGWMKQGELENSWFVFSEGPQNWLILALEFSPREETLEWANTVLRTHADKQVVIVTHAYLYHDSHRFDWKKYGDAQDYSPTTYIDARYGTGSDGETIWQRLVSQHPHIRFVLCGHVIGSGAAYLGSKGKGGQTVHQILSNYQPHVDEDRGVGGGGFLRLLRFLPDGKNVQVRTYSPWYHTWLTDKNHHFDLLLN